MSLLKYLCVSLIFLFLSTFVSADAAGEQEEVSTLPVNSVNISEVHPAPNSSNLEWIEIYNHSENPVDLTGFQLFDLVSSESLLHQFEAVTLESHSFTVIELSQSKLNNKGDTVILKNSQSEIIDQLAYSNTSPEMSVSRLFLTQTEITDKVVSQQPTPNAPNIVQEAELQTPTPTPTNYPEISILKAENCPSDNQPEFIQLKTINENSVSLEGWYLKDLQDNIIQLNEYSILNIQIIELPRNILNNTGDTVFLLNPNDEIVSKYEMLECATNIQTTNKKEKQTEKSLQITEKIESNTTDKKTINKSQQQREEATSKELKLHTLLSQELSKEIFLDYNSDSNSTKYIEHKIQQKQSSKTGIVSVIIGGTILLLSGIIL